MPQKPKHSMGWLTFSISEAREKEARNMRAERDRLYGNIFNEHSTDERWVGDLGEMVFDHWLKLNEISAEWILNDAAGRPDFILGNGTKIGVKTVKRKVRPQNDYTAQITAGHVNENVDQFAFMSYEIKHRRMWFLGGILKKLFNEQARYYAAGEWVHKYYQIRQGHEIYNIGLARLAAPDRWLAGVVNSTST